MRGTSLAFCMGSLIAVGVSVACSTSDDASSSPVDGGSTTDAATLQDGDFDGAVQTDAGTSQDGSTYTPIRINDDNECLPTPFPTNDAGELDCRMLLLFNSGQCSDEDLAPATSADVAAIDALATSQGAARPTGPLCVLPQIAGACVNAPADGWCYITGSCHPDAGCAQDICTSAGYDAGTVPPGGMLACP